MVALIDQVSSRAVGWSMSYTVTNNGAVCDNADMENFFSSIKTERIGKKVYRRGCRRRQTCSTTWHTSATRHSATRP